MNKPVSSLQLECWTDREKKLRIMLKDLEENHGCVGLKLGTEVEACSFEYIEYINRLANGIVPVIVKIGGPDARNDIRTLSKIGVSGTIAPMVESTYGLENYVSALKEMAGERFESWFKGINIETINGFNMLPKMLEMPEAKMLDQITIGRSDLSGSLGKTVDDPEVIEICKRITEMAHKAGLLVSVGGGVTPSNAKMVAEKVGPDKVNTRHVVFGVKDSPDLGAAVKKGLEFEEALLRHEEEELSAELKSVEERIEELKKRIIR